ncbi:PPK2 family polyphosphate kinase [Robiginitomaculum antarcticum]|uniref:PPK2 family polyphosphate kinase n=1 Tax=Robiginitomaculum antarcticum TaxID=437507 RepID=UPI000369F362|nr:PPK2 family polyphosphate kinase [Robiginitomaculum antarcticum]
MTDYRSKFIVSPGTTVSIKDCPTRVSLFSDKDAAKDSALDDAKTIEDLAHKLYGESQRSLILVLQGMDTSGKDGTTSAVFARTPPLNVYVASFKAPSKTELAHDYLWRVHNVCPANGQIAVFNRSHYEDVLVVKVRKFASAEDIEKRYDQINDFERLLTETGSTVIKCMLHMSHKTQGKRLAERLEEPDKRWKFNPDDLEDRKLWPKFMTAYETMLNRTSTAHAPWYVIPSDSRSTRKAIVANIVRKTLEDMNPAYPDPGYRPGDFDID